MEFIATLIGLAISLVLAVWVGRDASRRQTQTAPFLWGFGVLLVWLLFFPLYLAKRPLKTGEVRSGGRVWNFMKYLAIAVSAYVPIVMVLALSDVAAQATSVEEAVALVVSLMLLMGLVWMIFAGGVLLIGLLFKKSSVIERGPTGTLAQASGGQYAKPYDSGQPEARRQSYSGDVQSSVNSEHQEGYGELASIKEIVDLSPQQALDEAQTFLVRQGYSIMERKGESLAMQRRFPYQPVEQNTLDLRVTALHQTEGGVQISVTGNDHEGVKEWQSAWAEWAEGLPKR
ncbi:MAG: hypothetical protein AVDCRST_MAG93-7404 [uncultured Chloroflexia bacterium]|uniref:Uncharacterized protein n=1 Tax=uncultured Chloroflexia bacterium TaxID=1672391 RepID=A0A6J4MFF2_9CHLR|nr:MAG: hypothetical protein AVDCRST_MAG93-7404 [uncultured Chloroflexia bacterium]